jgi:hypothetical protein
MVERISFCGRIAPPGLPGMEIVHFSAATVLTGRVPRLFGKIAQMIEKLGD